ncbi:MAG: acetate--CoA ligase family protein [Clostridiales bacterium]|nr:acetate--CoA ligase family protein [Clostridiales bacterium]
MNLSRVNSIFRKAEQDGRRFLLEPEVYALLRACGIATPRFLFLKKGQKADRKNLSALRTPEVVVKVVSPLIVHKSDVGGVAFVPGQPANVNEVIRSMVRDVPKKFSDWQRKIGSKKTYSPEEIRNQVRGFLILEKVAYKDSGFGSELLVGLRHSREFGPIVTMGLGGLDVEYLSERLKEGKALAIGSAPLLRQEEIASLLRPLAFFDKITKEHRGRKAAIKEDELVSAFSCFLRLGAHFSPYARMSPYVIEEAEVNPFVVVAGRLVPLDGMCRFSRAHVQARPRLSASLDFILHPRSIGIIGVSERMNLGRIILKNILREGFPGEKVYIVKPGVKEIDGCRCLPGVSELPETVDLFVLTLAAEQSVGVMKELVRTQKARSVVIIAGGLGEKTGTEALEKKIRELISHSRKRGRLTPIVNGGNCMGIYSAPGKYDTTFIPEYKLASPGKKNPRLVYISQSGAFMASRMSKLPFAEPRYAISLGNQIDLTASDYLNYFNNKKEVFLLALYLEGFQPGDGLALARAAQEAARKGKMVVVYKGGRTPEGREATSSHTASVAGDYAVCRSILETSGVFMAEDLTEFESAIQNLLPLSAKTPRGRRVGLISNAGFECVILADNLANRHALELASFSEKTRARIAGILGPLGIDRLQDVRNPLDVTPVADDATFAGCVKALLADPMVDCAVVSPVPMTSALQTLPPGETHRENIYQKESIGCRLAELFRKSPKPFVVNIDAGAAYQPLADLLVSAGVPVFRHSDRALRFLGKFVHVKLMTAEVAKREEEEGS